MSEALIKENEELKSNVRILSAQLNTHKDALNQLINENLNALTNFKLSQQYLGESQQKVKELSDELEKLKKENEDLKNKFEETCEGEAAQTDAA